MRKLIFISSLFLCLSAARAAEVKILKMEGEVKYRESISSEWKDALPSTIVPEGGAIKTGINGMAVVDTGNKSAVWMRENTALEVEQKKDLITRLGLVFGKIKARIPHLMRKEKFELRTPTAVCAVRGTDLVMESDMEGRMNLQVLFGSVKMSYTVPPLKGDKEFTLSQGEYISIKEKDKPARPMIMDKKMELEGLAKWDPGLSDKARMEDIKQKEADRAQIRDFASSTARTEAMVSNFTSRGRESDIEAGRTLRDIHGNLVRVDQRLMRPDPSTLQFLNLVKRPVYTYKGTSYSEFKYNGSASVENRYDMAVFTMNFNKELPQSVSEWPSFFNKNSVDPSWSTFVFANRTYSEGKPTDEIFFNAEAYKYDAVRDELVNNESVVGVTLGDANVHDRDIIVSGMLTGANSYEALGNVINLKFEDAGSSNGTLKYTSDASLSGSLGSNVFWFSKVQACNTPNCTNFYERTGDAEDKLYQIEADLYARGGDYSSAANLLWYGRENYVISNGGSIRGKDDFVNAGNDIFSILKNSGAESVIYMKQFDTSSVSGWSALTRDNVRSSISENDYFTAPNHYASGTNIDLVIIPDLALAGVQKVLPALDNLKD